MYRSGNPALTDATFDKRAYSDAPWWDDQESTMMSMEGTTEKTGILLIIIATTAIGTAMFMPEAGALSFFGLIAGFILAMVIIFTNSTSAPLICSYSLSGPVSRWSHVDLRAELPRHRNFSSCPHIGNSRSDANNIQSGSDILE